MKLIGTPFHSILDYVAGLFLILSPWIFNFDQGGTAQKMAIISGILLISSGFFTNYEGGAIRLIPVRLHLVIDVFVGLFLALSPWLFHFKEIVFLPHLIMGLIISLTALLTTPVAFLHKPVDHFKSRFGQV